MSDTTSVETIATYEHDGVAYEIDHLGICAPSQYGEYAVYQGGEQIAEFAVEASLYIPGHRPPLPELDMLVALAKAAVSDIAGGAR